MLALLLGLPPGKFIQELIRKNYPNHFTQRARLSDCKIKNNDWGNQ